MYARLNKVLADGLSSIDSLLSNKMQERSQNTISAATWSEDSHLSATVTALKDVSKVAANSCLKFVLLLKTGPSDAILASLIDEVYSQTDILLAQYFHFASLSPAECLFDSVSRTVRTFLSHVQELFQAVQERRGESLNYMVGVINKISEDMSKVPQTNKQAYRVLFMEQCLLIKETLQEFKAYIEDAHEKSAAASIADALETKLAAVSLEPAEAVAHDDGEGDNQNNEGGEEEEGDDFDEDGGGDDGELDYTAREVVVVEDCVKLLGKALGCIKHTLQIATAVCDAAQAQFGASETVFTTASAASDAASEAHRGVVQYSQQWVAQLAHLSQLLKKDVLNLGAELYPPFEKDCSVIEGHFATLRSHCLDYLRLTNADALRALQTAENSDKIAQLLREVDECCIRC